MDIAEKSLLLKKDLDDVYEAGKKAEYDAFWDGITRSGARTDFNQAFAYWDMEYIRPNRKIVIGSGRQLFYYSSVKKVESDYFDFSQTPYGTNAQQGFYYTFYECEALEEIEDIGMQPNYGYNTTFANCPNLHTIAVIRCDENTLFNNVFHFSKKIKHLNIDGVIAKNGFNIQWSTLLTHESLMSIINALKDYSGDTSGTVHTITLGAANLAKLSADEIDIIEQKGWNYG